MAFCEIQSLTRSEFFCPYPTISTTIGTLNAQMDDLDRIKIGLTITVIHSGYFPFDFLANEIAFSGWPAARNQSHQRVLSQNVNSNFALGGMNQWDAIFRLCRRFWNFRTTSIYLRVLVLFMVPAIAFISTFL